MSALDEPAGHVNRCLVCARELTSVFGDDGPQCNDAVQFYATGSYGSTLWDWVSSTDRLLINVCDGCLSRLKDLVLVERIRHVAPIVTYLAFTTEGLTG